MNDKPKSRLTRIQSQTCLGDSGVLGGSSWAIQDETRAQNNTERNHFTKWGTRGAQRSWAIQGETRAQNNTERNHFTTRGTRGAQRSWAIQDETRTQRNLPLELRKTIRNDFPFGTDFSHGG